MAFRFNAINGILDLTGSSSTTPQVTSIYFGDPATDGTWVITTSGNNLSFQRRESGVYVEKSAVTP